MKDNVKQDERLLLEQVNQLYEQSHIASLGACFASGFTGIILWPLVPHANLVGWVTAAVSITLIRHFFIIRYRRLKIAAKDAPARKKLFLRLVFASGLIWGSSAVFIFPETSFTHQVFLSFILVGMVSGAIGTFSAILTTFLAYALPALVPLCIVFFTAGTTIQQSMGAMVLLYLCLVSISAYHLFNKTRTSLNLQFENIDLIHFLEEEKHRSDSINNHLKEEVKERKQIEKILERHRENLESMIDERTNALKKSNIDLKMEIAEREKTEKALKESEEKYRLLVENSNDAILIYQSGVSQFHNKRAETLLGCSARELHEVPFAELIRINGADSADPHFLENLPQSLSAGGRESIIPPGNTRKIINRKNELLWIKISTIAVTWENAPALLCFLRDITQEKRLETQLFQAQKIEAIGTMAAGIAHDFNNILSSIQGNTSLALLNMDPEHRFYKRLRDIESYIAAGTDLTRQLVDYANPKTGDQQPVDVSQLLNDIVSMFCRTKKELRLSTDYKSTGRIIEADAGQIRQALINLLVNAWQAMPDGGELHVSTRDISAKEMAQVSYKAAPGDYIEISIADSGIGIDPTLISKIFDPFFSTKKRGKGTGLGLSSVYGIIESHRGHISVDSRPGHGSTFYLYLPISHKKAPPAPPTDESIATGNESILIVDDEPEILEIGREILEAIGYSVYSASSGSQALEIYETCCDRIDLVILDMVMPGMSGEQVFDHLKRINPDVRVLISSGYSQRGPVERVLKKGGSGFIQKPFKLQLLSQTIRKILT